jgi:tetratricopeptide (TPR) repeat protein
MVEAAPQQALRHSVFLRRLAEASSGSSQARRGHGAFLALRLVDLLDPQQERVRPDAFGYQLAAMDRVCRELPGDSTETAHLVGLVQAAADAYRTRDAQLVVPALLAYAHYLEDELLLSEALDVLETVVRVGGDALRSADRVASRLRVARVLRKLNEFDAAEQAYQEAGALAAAGGDRRSELLSRIGRARTASGRGNLVEGEKCLRSVLVDADHLADRDVQARIHQEIAVVLNARGQPAEAIGQAWLAFQLYEDEPSRMRVLNDVGVMLLKVGDVEAAERALTESERRAMSQEVVDSASIELMHCASFRGDQVGFERWRERCEARSERMPPNMLADFTLKAGIGRARFGQFDRADALLATALRIAERAGLHEAAFRIERIKNGLRDCRHAWPTSHDRVPEPRFLNAAVREVSDALGYLVT